MGVRRRNIGKLPATKIYYKNILTSQIDYYNLAIGKYTASLLTLKIH